MTKHRSAHQRPTSGVRRYPRVARVNESLREVIADELELLDDNRLHLVTVTGINADPDLRHATVFFSALTGSGVVAAGEALAENRARLQRAVGRELRLKRTPMLVFAPDPAIIEGDKIESILRTMPRSDPELLDPADRADLTEPTEPTEPTDTAVDADTADPAELTHRGDTADLAEFSDPTDWRDR